MHIAHISVAARSNSAAMAAQQINGSLEAHGFAAVPVADKAAIDAAQDEARRLIDECAECIRDDLKILIDWRGQAD